VVLASRKFLRPLCLRELFRACGDIEGKGAEIAVAERLCRFGQRVFSVVRSLCQEALFNVSSVPGRTTRVSRAQAVTASICPLSPSPSNSTVTVVIAGGAQRVEDGSLVKGIGRLQGVFVAREPERSGTEMRHDLLASK
jgi:hypothetical protein